MATEVFIWWLLLCSVSVANVVALLFSVRALQQRRSTLTQQVYAARKLQIWLCAGYVVGCAYRSVLPVFDVQRICLVDSWMSSVIVGRSVATIAELCFVTQWALLLHEISGAAQSRPARLVALSVVPLIAIAETCSWYSVLTTSNLGHVIEESLWGLSAALLVFSLLSIWPRCRPSMRPAALLMAATGIAYVAFMFLVDVPMYWDRWVADEAIGRIYLSLDQGVMDAAGRWVVSHHWSDWKTEVVWMSLYFSVAVWLSIALVHTPALDRHIE